MRYDRSPIVVRQAAMARDLCGAALHVSDKGGMVAVDDASLKYLTYTLKILEKLIWVLTFGWF
ncbi:MAG: hypothetical protein V4573_13715 [Pseudomonadota bacterium]